VAISTSSQLTAKEIAALRLAMTNNAKLRGTLIVFLNTTYCCHIIAIKMMVWEMVADEENN
jgi:hypothetical protein